ncbi:MAG: WbqC family protein [Saprospiraceae bacterium]
MSNLLRAALPFFGSTLLWSEGLKAGGFTFRQNEHYQRRTQRNRTVITNSHGRQTLSIPLLGGKHQSCPITEVQISYAEDWRRQHWLSIQAAYGSAPFYLAFEDELQELFSRKPDTLWEWNWGLIEWVAGIVAPKLVLAKADDWIPEIDTIDATLKAVDNLQEYPQIFSERTGWMSNLSVLDLIMCQGTAAAASLK